MHRLFTKRRGDEGFTLIELLVVVVIIGVLVAIAIPVYLNYREGAADKAAQSDVRGAIAAVEQFYTTNGNQYPSTAMQTSGPGAWPANAQVKFTISTGVELRYVPGTGATAGKYAICAKNVGGNTTYRYDNNAGSVSVANTTVANCAGPS